VVFIKLLIKINVSWTRCRHKMFRGKYFLANYLGT